MKLSDRINSVEESQTVQFTRLLQQLRNQGRAVINLAVGEPHLSTPVEVIESTKRALDAGMTRYGTVSGLHELKTGLARQFEGYDDNNIIISNGSKQCLFSIFQVICNPVDEIIIPRPYWVSFPQQVIIAGGKPVFVDTRNHQLDCDAIKRALSPRTRAILINSPNNPTGAVYPAKELEQIAQIALERNLYIISDEAYGSFVYDGIKAHSPFEYKKIRDRLIVIRSFSKAYSMTGFRIGYMAAASEIINAVARLQSHLTGNVCTFAQYGALGALEMDEGIFAEWRDELEKKRDYAYDQANRLFDCIKPRGAFYLFPDVRQHLKNGMTAMDLAAHILENYGVAVVPGEVFGMSGHIRISYAVSEENLVSGFDKIAEAL
ncbi:MAG: pyridoxal phosphate-dependent aminotransferase [Desulfobacterales bacterium]